MIARIGALIVGLSLILMPLIGLPISRAASPRQAALPALSGLPVGPTRFSEPTNISVSADGTTFTQNAGLSSEATAFAPNACTLAAPVLIAPVGGVKLATLVPWFQWSRTVEDYRVQISTVSNFSVLVHDSSWGIGGTSAPSVPMNFNLLPNRAYYWRVASICEDWSIGPFSSPASFSTGNVTGPFTSAPDVIAPPDGAVQTALKVTFSWGHVAGATRWQIRLYHTLAAAQSDDQWHRTPNMGRWSTSWRTSTTWTLSTAGTYYWRVGAGTDAGWGSLSPVRSFTAGAPTYAVTGTVRDSNGAGIGGVIVSGSGRSASTDASGSYRLEGLLAGAYTLTPALAGFTFSPASRSVTVPPNAAGQDFVGTPPPRLKLLVVPLRWQGPQASFDTEAKTQSDIFINDVPLKDCRNRVVVETLDVGTQNFSTFACSTSNCGVGSVRTFVRDVLHVDPADYDVIVGLSASSPCAPIAGCSNGTDTIWVTSAYDSVTAHELGHIYDLEDEYCSNQAGSTDSRCNDGDSQGDGATTGDVNWLDASLPCDCAPDGSNDSGGSACCNFGGRSCAAVNYGVCCQGNKNVAGGRSTMSYADAPAPRGFDSHDKAYLNALPELSCGLLSNATGFAPGSQLEDVSRTVLDVNLRVHQNDNVDEVSTSITYGRPTPDSVLQGMAGDYSLEITKAGGETLWTQAFALYFDYTGPVVLDTDYSGISYDEVPVEFRIPYQCGMSGLNLYHGGKLIFSRTLPYKCLFLPLILRGN